MVFLVIDAHLHFYDIYNADLFFDSFLANMDRFFKAGHPESENGFVRIGVLTEGAEAGAFARLARSTGPGGRNRYSLQAIGEPGAWLLLRDNQPAAYLITGRQVGSGDKLEFLTLGAGGPSPVGTFAAAVQAGLAENEPVILAWGPGKWLGRRGKTIASLLRQAPASRLFLGDSRARPRWWPQRRLFRLARQKGVRVLAGSDPLPLAGEEKLAGSFGFILAADFDAQLPLASLRRAVFAAGKIEYFGRRDSCRQFFTRQVKMALRRPVKGSRPG